MDYGPSVLVPALYHKPMFNALHLSRASVSGHLPFGPLASLFRALSWTMSPCIGAICKALLNYGSIFEALCWTMAPLSHAFFVWIFYGSWANISVSGPLLNHRPSEYIAVFCWNIEPFFGPQHNVGPMDYGLFCLRPSVGPWDYGAIL